MTKARDNHYVPQWHQKGFTDERENQLRHLKQKTIQIPSGQKVITSKKWYTPTQCFYETDLYTTFFGSEINDEIEQRLFGFIDSNGSEAVRAFLTDEKPKWQKHFEDFFIYLDAQKLRTPKGIDWIRSKYPKLKQNELMIEMQALRTIHCTLWAEGVRELVSAEDSAVKFIVSDHPVTVYNYACPPNNEWCRHPNDPDIAFKGSQTIFPLNKNRCLILTNLEYAKDSSGTDPLALRTNPTKIRQSFVNSIAFINNRKLTADEVTKINHIIKIRAHESIAAGQEEWLYPENNIDCNWADLRHVLLPPSNKLWHYGGDMYARFEDGSTHYQDAFGRITPPNEHLKKINESVIGRNDPCGCGSNKKYKKCCLDIPKNLRTTWSVLSIRERNLIFCRAIASILGISNGKSWNDVKRDISDENITEIYRFYSSLWPRDTNIYSMLPKSDGRYRALYTGVLDVRTIGNYALGMAPLFDEFLVESPITNPNTMKPEFSPTESPSSYKYQALKDFAFMFALEPMIYAGLVNLIPSPTEFDQHLLQGVMSLASERPTEAISDKDHKLHFELGIQDLFNCTHSMDYDVKKRMLINDFGLSQKKATQAIQAFEAKAEDELLTFLQPDIGSQLMPFKMAPNYEMALFIAQATGSIIVTDSESRWMQLKNGWERTQTAASYPWDNVYTQLQVIPLDYESIDKFRNSYDATFIRLRQLLKSIDELVRANEQDITKVEQLKQQVISFNGQLTSSDNKTSGIKVLAPEFGIIDSTVQRLLVRSGCPTYDRHVRAVYLVGSQL